MSGPAPLHPSLPPKPDHTLRTPPPVQPEASTSKAALCMICAVQLAKYTCPGCATRTCSAPCAGAHKRTTGCTGERDKAKYVPMNEYSWGNMMNDYSFLEDVGRKVETWGKEIVKGGYMHGASGGDRGRGGGGRGRGRGRGGSGTGPAKTKRDILRSQLLAQDIDIEMLSVGMERRKQNQSTWDFRNQTALLTIELKFYKPKDPLAPLSTPRVPPFTIITHKNNIQSSLLNIIRSHVHIHKTSKTDITCPEWVKRLVYPDPDDPEAFSSPQCVMAARLDPLSSRDRQIKAAAYSLDPNQPLSKALCHTEFVEFPTIEVWDEYPGIIIAASGVIGQREEHAAKRRKLNPKAGKATITGLLGDYGSDDEDGNQELPKSANILDMLGGYADSDDEKSSIGGLKEGNVEMDDATLTLSDEEDEDVQVDPAVLFELLRAAGGDVAALEGKNAQGWEDAGGEELE